jgi:uncharacterized protein (UPF0333 family)
MATVKAYVANMLDVEQKVAFKFDSDISQLSKEFRVLNLAILVVIAVVVKTLTDNGVITDAQLNAVLTAARDDSYPPEPS